MIESEEENLSDVYYRLYVTKEDYVTVVCFQYFDEDDYDENRFLCDEDGVRLMFDTEDEAIQYLNQNIKPEKIHPDYKRTKFHRSNYFL